MKFSKDHATLFGKALALASKCHAGQKRKNGKAFISHPLAVAEILKKYEFPIEAQIAGLLHDVCEDSKITNLEVKEMFGERVGFIIKSLSKNRKPEKDDRLEADYQQGNGRQLYQTIQDYLDYRFLLYINRFYNGISYEPWILFIKIADQLDNLADMEAFRLEKKKRKIEEVEKYFIPMYERSRVFMEGANLKKYEIFMGLLRKTLDKAKKDL